MLQVRKYFLETTTSISLKIKEITWHIFMLTLLCLRECANSISCTATKDERGQVTFKHCTCQNHNEQDGLGSKLTSRWEGERTPSSFWRSRKCIISWSSRKLLKKALAEIQAGFTTMHSKKILQSGSKLHKTKQNNYLLGYDLWQQDPWNNG